MSIKKILLKEYLDSDKEFINLSQEFGTHNISNTEFKSKIKEVEWNHFYYPILEEKAINDDLIGYAAYYYLQTPKNKYGGRHSPLKGMEIVNTPLYQFTFQSEDSRNPFNGDSMEYIVNAFLWHGIKNRVKRYGNYDDKKFMEYFKKNRKEYEKKMKYYERNRTYLYKKHLAPLMDIMSRSTTNMSKGDSVESELNNLKISQTGLLVISKEDRTVYLDHCLFYLLFYNRVAVVSLDQPYEKLGGSYIEIEDVNSSIRHMNMMDKSKEINSYYK